MNPTNHKHHQIAAATFIIASALATTAPADTINYVGPGLDLADPDNWSQQTWTAADTLQISTNQATIPATGLYLSGDMPASSEIKIGEFPTYNVTIDFGGHSLNTTNLNLTSMHNNDYRYNYLLATGGFSGVKNIKNNSRRGHIRFANGVFKVENGLDMRDWFPFVQVLDGAELVIEKIVADVGVGMSGPSSGEFIVDGGKFVIQDHASNAFYKRAQWSGNDISLCQVSIKSGGEYRDDSRTPVNFIGTLNFMLKDAGYFETNSATTGGNTLFFGKAGTKSITNSIFRLAQLYCGYFFRRSEYTPIDAGYKLSGTTVDFCDSEETFAFAPDYSGTTAGMVVPPTATNNTIRFRGDRNRFTSQTFVLGGSNTVAVTGGSFAVSNVFEFVDAAEGSGSRLILKDADVYLARVSASATASNTLIEVSGSATVKGGGNFTTGGPGSAMRVSDGAVVDIGTGSFRLAGNGSELCLSGAASTGCVEFVASDCRAVVESTAHATKLGSQWTRYAPFWFAEGQSNNVLVISNATFRCGSNACKGDITPESSHNEPIPFTGVPGCAIELRGARARLVFPTNAAHSHGGGYFTMAFGEMIDYTIGAKGDYTTDYYTLDNPLRLRFVLPPTTDPYLEAPVQSLRSTLCLGGNAEFEFDMSEYNWPKGSVTIPLISCANGFKATFGTTPPVTHTYINVDQLNATNADRLPKDKLGRRVGKLVLSADGKTLCLTVNNIHPTLILFH